MPSWRHALPLSPASPSLTRSLFPQTNSLTHSLTLPSQTDNFFITAPNVGPMKCIKLRSTGSGLGSSWHLAKVEVASAATGERLVFPWNK